jgi:hypothetical protein
MNAPRRQSPIDRAELELLHDGRLGADDAQALRERLETEPAMRRALDQIRELDGLATQALLSSAGAAEDAQRQSAGRGDRHDRRRVRGVAWAGAGLAACIIGAIVLMPMLGKTNTGGGTDTASPSDAIAMSTEDDEATDPTSPRDASPEETTTTDGVGTVIFASRSAEYAPVRTVFAIRLASTVSEESVAADDSRAGDTNEGLDSVDSDATSGDAALADADDPGEPTTTLASAVESETSLLTRLDTALANGDSAAAAQLIASADDASKPAMYRRLGAAMRSARTAADLLDRLPGEVAVDVCGAWIEQRTMQPLAMRHLSDRAANSALRDRVHQTVHDLLDRDPSLRPWMVSYVNWAVRREPQVRDETPEGARSPDPLDGWNAVAIVKYEPGSRGSMS